MAEEAQVNLENPVTKASVEGAESTSNATKVTTL